MKKFFKIVLIIFILALSFLTEPQSLHAYQINNDGYIENVEKETGIFVLNNFLGEEIRPIKNETQPNISSSSSLATSIEENPKFLINGNCQKIEFSIYRLSADLKEINSLLFKARNKYVQHIQNGELAVEYDYMILNLFTDIGRTTEHCVNITQMILEKK